MLAALGCVDAIAVFSEDTPCAALEPDTARIWVKGGDYDSRDLPEAALAGRLGRGGRHRPLSERPIHHAAARGAGRTGDRA